MCKLEGLDEEVGDIMVDVVVHVYGEDVICFFPPEYGDVFV